jgi:hypothetical protein
MELPVPEPSSSGLPPDQDSPDNLGDAFFLSQFRALRDEMVKHIELRDQLLSIALIAFGSLSAAMAQNPKAPFLFLYPVLALFLASAWGYHERVIRRIGAYIRDELEPQVRFEQPPEGTKKLLWWENYLHKPVNEEETETGITLTISGRGAALWIFVGTSALALLVGLALWFSTNALPKNPLTITLDVSSLMQSLPSFFWFACGAAVIDLLVIAIMSGSIHRATR